MGVTKSVTKSVTKISVTKFQGKARATVTKFLKNFVTFGCPHRNHRKAAAILGILRLLPARNRGVTKVVTK